VSRPLISRRTVQFSSRSWGHRRPGAWDEHAPTVHSHRPLARRYRRVRSSGVTTIAIASFELSILADDGTKPGVTGLHFRCCQSSPPKKQKPAHLIVVGFAIGSAQVTPRLAKRPSNPPALHRLHCVWAYSVVSCYCEPAALPRGRSRPLTPRSLGTRESSSGAVAPAMQQSAQRHEPRDANLPLESLWRRGHANSGEPASGAADVRWRLRCP
jgi:hypothetical protein